MVAKMKSKMGITPRTVIRGVKCQIKNEVGIDWLRISFLQQHLKKILRLLEFYFGKAAHDGRGLWSYTDRYFWPNRASLNYDSDVSRADLIHNGKFTIEIPGGALGEITETDL
ncbi:unnamed protein product, partial [marine sediment metagenome]